MYDCQDAYLRIWEHDIKSIYSGELYTGYLIKLILNASILKIRQIRE